MKKNLWVRKTSSVEVDLINLTPLIDVIFVILVAFILIAPLLQIDSVALAKKGTEQKEQFFPKKGAISLYVKQNDTFWIEKKAVSLTQLEKLLEKEPKDKEIYLFQDKKASFGSYQEIKNLSEKLGFSTLKVILQNS